MMMKLKKLLAAVLALILVFSLTACGADDSADKKEEPTPSASPSASPSAGEEDQETMSEEEKSAFYQEKLADYTQRVAGLDPDEVLLTINGEEITAELYLYWLTYDCMYWDSMNRYMYGNPLDFGAEGSTGLTYREYLKEDSLQLLLNYVVMLQHAKEEGCDELTAEQQKLWDERNLQHTEAYGEADADYMFAQSGMREELFTSIQTCSYIYDNLCTALNPAPSQEELDMFIQMKDLLRAKHILIRTAKDGDNGTIMYNSDGTVVNDEDGNPYQGGAEKYNAEALALANDLCAQLEAADDPHALFDELMVIYSEDPGSQAQPEGYDFTAGKMVEEFENGTRALEYGEISEPVESSFGYHIILRLRPDVLEDYLTETMGLYLNSWMYNAEIEYTDLFHEMDIEAIYKEYVVYQEELLAVRNG